MHYFELGGRVVLIPECLLQVVNKKGGGEQTNPEDVYTMHIVVRCNKNVALQHNKNRQKNGRKEENKATEGDKTTEEEIHGNTKTKVTETGGDGDDLRACDGRGQDRSERHGHGYGHEEQEENIDDAGRTRMTKGKK